MGSQSDHQFAIRYKGFLLLPEANSKWLVRPERSPMILLPFRTKSCSLEEVKTIIDGRLNEINNHIEAA